MKDFKRRNKAFKDAARGHWLEVMSQLTSATNAVEGWANDRGRGVKKTAKSPCPFGNHKEDSFFFMPEANENGYGHCYKCGQSWPPMEILEAYNPGVTKPQLYREVESIIGFEWDEDSKQGHSTVPPPKKFNVNKLTKKEERERHANIARLINKLWSESYDLGAEESSIARRYLANRGIGEVSPFKGHVHFHPRVPYTVGFEKPNDGMPLDDEDRDLMLKLQNHPLYQSTSYWDEAKQYPKRIFMGYHPAVLQMVRDTRTFEGIGLQRLYITPEGKKLSFFPASEPQAKRCLSKKALGIGAAISGLNFLDAPGAVMGIAEGLETALAVRQWVNIPMGSTVNANGVKKFIPPLGAKVVLVFEDKDASLTGEKCTDALRERLAPEDILVIRVAIQDLIPHGKKGLDWLDVLKDFGPMKLPQWALNADRFHQWHELANN